ncbi:phosphoglycolate phosphatase [Phaeobacter sp. PT47_59]|uniref:phosphoglycolate phosphatase n=1 Tax=Phaeobacter sp. PT47_59 TaxID=3029979 RepID=UPI00238089BA|nr:phosphoglycolate phosphatase [Phaeobacter sp. PT47_59]MDE4172686.1 phosphoglycolate phosphatase [Phaeobacter sp. PT47_59]
MSQAIVFDLDGTLIDSAPDIHAAANRMLQDFDHTPLTLERVTSFIGNGIPNLVRLVMQERGIPETEEDTMQARMLVHYMAHPADLSQPYPGVTNCLQTLRDQGYKLGVCTNKLRAPSIQILDALDLSRFFEVVVGGDTLPVKKPDPAPLHAAFQALGGNALLYVGDSEVDAATAQAAKIPFALFTKGYRKTPVEDLPSSVTFDDFTKLTAIAGQESGVSAV